MFVLRYINLSTLWKVALARKVIFFSPQVSLDAQQVSLQMATRPPVPRSGQWEKSSVPLFIDFFRFFYLYHFNSITFSLEFLQCLHTGEAKIHCEALYNVRLVGQIHCTIEKVSGKIQ